MPHPLEAGTIRILKPDSSTAGTGFLVSKRLAVTCAHVVVAAKSQPGDVIKFEYHLGDLGVQEAKVLQDGWSTENDVAILELTEKIPNWIHPIIMQSSRALEGRSFQGLGYPDDGSIEARWVQGKIGGSVKAKEYSQPLLQIQGDEVDQGLSGSAVMDQVNRFVVGMVTGYRDVKRTPSAAQIRFAYAVPIETIWEVYPVLQDLNKTSLQKKTKSTSIKSRYQKYLTETEISLQEWEKRYTPLFAKIGRLEIFAKLRASKDQAPEQLLDLVKNNHNLVIVGTAGSGKSTTLTKIALEAAQEYKESKKNSKIPILLQLRDFNGNDLNSYLESHLITWGIPSAQIEKDLDAGRYLLLFDGLNEIPQIQKDNCFKLIRNFMRAYSRNRYVFTSRNIEYREDWLEVNGKTIPACEIQPLTDNQIEQYITRYFGIGSKSAEKLISELHEHDLETWKNPRSLVQLAKVPLLLQMLIFTFQEHQRIPQNEGELILKYVDIILIREPGKEAGKYPPELKKELLGTVARKMFDLGHLWAISKGAIFEAFSRRITELKSVGSAKQEYEPLDIWDELKNNNLLIEQDDDVFFQHPLMQDLFVSLSLRSSCFRELLWEPNIKEIYIRFGGQRAKWFGDPDFDSGIMMLGIVPEKYQLSALAVVASINPTLSYEAFQKLEPDYKAGLSERFFQELLEDSLSEKLDRKQYENLVDTIGKFKQKSVYEYLKQIAEKCPSKHGRRNVVYKIWSEHIANGDDAIFFLKKLATTDNSEDVRATCLQVLSRTENIEQSKELLEFLIERFEAESQGFINKNHLGMGRVLNSDIAVDKLYTDSLNSSFPLEKRQKSIWLLGRTSYREKTNELLCELAHSNETINLRREAVQSLQYFASPYTVKTMHSILTQSNNELKIDATITLKSCNKFNSLPVLMIALSDSFPEVGEKAIDALCAIASKVSVFKSLVEGANSVNPILSRRSITALARIAEDETMKYSSDAALALSHHLAIQDKMALLEVAWGIRKVDLQKSNQILFQLMNDSDNSIRELASQRAELLGLI
jgi:hypothetical protein